MALIHKLSKKAARVILEVASVACFQTLVLIFIYPEFRSWVAALLFTVFLMTALVLVFEFFYDDPNKDE